MTILDRIFLLLAGMMALYTIVTLLRRNKSLNTIIFHIISLSVLTISGILLIIFGWDILGLMGDGIGNKLVAIVASLIPFAWALGVVSHLNKQLRKIYLPLLTLGIILISISRFSNSPEFARMVYPLFHGLAGLTIVVLPSVLLKKTQLKRPYLLVSLGGLFISVGGLALSFIMSGRQLLFFSADFVLMILAPLLFMTTLAYGAGLIWGTDQ